MYSCSARRVFFLNQIQLDQFEKKSVEQNISIRIYTPGGNFRMLIGGVGWGGVGWGCGWGKYSYIRVLLDEFFSKSNLNSSI